VLLDDVEYVLREESEDLDGVERLPPHTDPPLRGLKPDPSRWAF